MIKKKVKKDVTKITESAWERAAKRTVAPSGKGRRTLSKKPIKKGEAVTKAAYDKAAHRSVTPSGKGSRKQSAKPNKGKAFSSVARRTIGKRRV